MDKKLEKLNKMLELIQNETLTPKDVEKFLTFVLSVVQKSKESIESMSSEHINQMKDILAYVEKEHEKIISIIDEKDEEKEERFNSKISEVKSLLEEIKKIEVKDGENGKDADEEIIVEKVLSQIKLPEYKETVLDDGAEIVAKINDLDINDDDLKIDASHVKNLPKFVQNQIGGVVARNIYQMDDVVLASITTNDILKWNGTKWVNTAGFDPAVSLADVSDNSTTAPLSLYTMTSTIPVEFRSSDGNSLLYLNETSEYIRVGVSALTEKFSISGANNDTFGILRVHSTGGALPNSGISLTTDVSGSGYRNWQIATNYSTGGTFEILRSTSNGGNPTTNAFTISSAGNVGIGTTAPSNQLHLYTNTAVAGTTGIKIENIATNGYANISFTTDAGTAQFVASGSTYSNGALRGSAFNLYSPGANGIVLESAHATGQLQIVTGGNAAGNIRMTVDQNGLVGIGTTTARSLLSVYTAAASTKITLERGSTGMTAGDEYGSIDFYGNDSSSNASGVRARMVGLAEDNVGKTGLAFYTTTSSSTTLSEIMRVNNVGVGIGTTAPATRLHVVSTTEQLRLAYSATEYQSFEVGSTGILTITPAGTTKEIITRGDYLRVRSTTSGESRIDLFAGGDGNNAFLDIFNNGQTRAISFQSASDSYFNGGSLGVGTTTVSAKLHVISTTEQLRLGYDSSNYVPFTVSSGGLLGIIPTGGMVGIGTNAPVEKLHVSNGVNTDSGTVTFLIGGSNGANARTGRIIKDTTTPYTMTIRSGDYAGTGLGSDLRFQTNNGDGDRITIKGGTGLVGIGVTAPTAVLHLKAGTATASTAPLKFNTGTNNTTAEAGAMEYNNTFHLTNSDATRRHIATAPNTTKVTAGAPYTNDGYVVINIGGTDFKVMTTA